MSPADGQGAAATRPFSVLVVCTGNVCRSPLYEALLRRGLGDGSDVQVTSAGVHARVGDAVDPRIARLVDVPFDGFVARQVTRDALVAADLVLTMTRDQRQAVVSAVPAAVRRTFTARDLADLARLASAGRAFAAEGPDSRRLRALLAAVPAVRPLRTPGPSDIEDPYGRGDEAYALAVRAVRGAVDDLVRAMRGAPASVPAGDDGALPD
ncbi:arsenate reductase/protein-tyrosine-phosphatase family protein [Modestobacter sp. SYSU DS0290]